MKNVKPIWKPQYRVTTDMVRSLMDIEAIIFRKGQERGKKGKYRCMPMSVDVNGT